MAEMLTLSHERIDDIPLLIGLAQQLRLPALLDEHLGNHGLHQGLSNGWLATVWLAYILSEGDHRKSGVEDWAVRHQTMLQRLVQQPLRRVDFTDDRLGIVLRRLSETPAWEALEAALWRSTVEVYEVELTGVRLDSTTSYGYHTPTEDGLMQFGHSKDQRPDLPQLKLMAAAAEPAAALLAADVQPGQAADEPLYQPLLSRVRQVLDRRGLLYTGDSKMAALATRADLVAHGDYYLLPLPLTNETGAQMAGWIDAVVAGEQAVQLIWDHERLLGGGYEFERVVQATVAGQPVSWTERVLIVRSLALSHHQTEQLNRRLVKAQRALVTLTSRRGRGKVPYREERTLQEAVAQLLTRHEVSGLLRVRWQREEQTIRRYGRAGRPSGGQGPSTEVRVRYGITAVERDEEAIAQQTARLGWRPSVTNQPAVQLSLAQALVHYRGGWSLERCFHLLKDRPLGISPLYVRNEDQIRGLTRLLTLGLRLLTLIETQLRQRLTQTQEGLTGLYEGQPTRTTEQPTAVRVLKAFTRAEVTLTRIAVGGLHYWHLTPLPPPLERILTHLNLSPALYRRLAENSS